MQASGERLWPELTQQSPPASAISSVLSNEYLLGEILLRLGSPDCLVVAALVCELWLRVVSDACFLRRFRALYPPRLLGFCVDADLPRPQFVPLPQHLGFAAAAAHRATHRCFGAYGYLAANHSPSIADCRDGRLLVDAPDRAKRLGITTPYRYALLSPPHTRESVQLLPPLPLPSPPPGVVDSAGHWKHVERVFLPEDGRGHGITWVSVLQVARRVTARVHLLESGGTWSAPSMAETELPEAPPCDAAAPVVETLLPPVNGEVYIVTTSGYTLGLHLSSTRFSVVKLPDAVRSCNFRLSMSHAEGSWLCLVHADGSHLSVWLCESTAVKNSGSAGAGWVLADTLCVREVCQGLEWLPESGRAGRVSVAAIGDNAEFVLLDMEQASVVIYVHLQSRTVKKVYDGDGRPARVFPLTTVWPPMFLARDDDDRAQREMVGCKSLLHNPDGIAGAVVLSCAHCSLSTSTSPSRASVEDNVRAVLPGRAGSFLRRPWRLGRIWARWWRSSKTIDAKETENK
ncbi:hypothetical protein ABZP36_003265 [Zizania latifolia]